MSAASSTSARWSHSTFPVNQLACSGVGQAGPLTDLVRRVQRQVKDGDLEAVERYLDNFDDQIYDIAMDYGFYDPREWATDVLASRIKKLVLAKLRGYRATRYRDEFASDPVVVERFERFYVASLDELKALGRQPAYEPPHPIPPPTRVIFGHTHCPVPWADMKTKTRVEGKTVYLHSTGGWLERKGADGAPEFVGAEVFRYRDGMIDSVRVS